MHVFLVLPDLAAACVRPEARAPAAHPTLARGPNLAHILAGARIERQCEGWAAALAPLYGVARQQDWPVAPLRALRHGLAADGAYWLRATPVSMIPASHDVRITGVAELDDDEAGALTDALGAHFATDGLEFFACARDEWLVQLPHKPALATRALDTVIGEPLRVLLATGDDAPRWRRWEHEIQMLLHGHAVNAAREQVGRVPVGAVWFDEGGTLPPATRTPIATMGGDARIGALAHFCGADAAEMPSSFDAVLGTIAGRERAVVAPPARDLAWTDSALAAPAYAALRAGTIARLSVMTAGPHGEVITWTTQAPGWRQRWFGRRPADLDEIVRAAVNGPMGAA